MALRILLFVRLERARRIQHRRGGRESSEWFSGLSLVCSRRSRRPSERWAGAGLFGREGHDSGRVEKRERECVCV